MRSVTAQKMNSLLRRKQIEVPELAFSGRVESITRKYAIGMSDGGFSPHCY